MQVLRGVCGDLFKKLQGTAQFLQSILDHLGDSDEARELIKKISEIHMDLNKSMQIADEIGKRHSGVGGYKCLTTRAFRARVDHAGAADQHRVG
jgi:hypothetical protein